MTRDLQRFLYSATHDFFIRRLAIFFIPRQDCFISRPAIFLFHTPRFFIPRSAIFLFRACFILHPMPFVGCLPGVIKKNRRYRENSGCTTYANYSHVFQLKIEIIWSPECASVAIFSKRIMIRMDHSEWTIHVLKQRSLNKI